MTNHEHEAMKALQTASFYADKSLPDRYSIEGSVAARTMNATISQAFSALAMVYLELDKRERENGTT